MAAPALVATAFAQLAPSVYATGNPTYGLSFDTAAGGSPGLIVAGSQMLSFGGTNYVQANARLVVAGNGGVGAPA